MSIVRENLMSRPGYSPYCGDVKCRFHMPRTSFVRGQFQCMCGWRSAFEQEFIDAYKAKWTPSQEAIPHADIAPTAARLDAALSERPDV